MGSSPASPVHPPPQNGEISLGVGEAPTSEHRAISGLILNREGWLRSTTAVEIQVAGGLRPLPGCPAQVTPTVRGHGSSCKQGILRPSGGNHGGQPFPDIHSFCRSLWLCDLCLGLAGESNVLGLQERKIVIPWQSCRKQPTLAISDPSLSQVLELCFVFYAFATMRNLNRSPKSISPSTRWAISFPACRPWMKMLSSLR